MQTRVRSICARINEIFEILTAQQHSKQPMQGVGSRMLRRLSTSTGVSRAKEKPLEMVGSQRKLAKSVSHQVVGTHTQKTDSSGQGDSFHITQEDIDSVEDEIDRQFSVVYDNSFKSQVKSESAALQQPPGVIRSPRDPQQPLRINRSSQAHQQAREFSSSSESDSEEDSSLILPLQPNRISHHDGVVRHQIMADTTGVVVPDRRDILVPKGKSRTSLLDNQDLFLPDASSLLTHTPSGPSNQPDLTTPPSSPCHKVEPRSPSELLSLRVRTLLMQTSH